MSSSKGARWWEMRPAQNRKPSTYRCPICGEYLPALIQHTLLFPEGDRGRRRHAHTACVLRERKAGRLMTQQEYERAQKDRLGSRESAWRMRWAFRPRLRRSRPSDS